MCKTILIIILVLTVPDVGCATPGVEGEGAVDIDQNFVEQIRNELAPLDYRFDDDESVLHGPCYGNRKEFGVSDGLGGCIIRSINQIQKWTKVEFSAENKCKPITTHLYTQYKKEQKITSDDIAEDLDHYLAEHSHLYKCQVVRSYETERE
ncbi:unnamed protein product, partial [Rotaria sordida]